MPVTMLRVNVVDGIGPVLQLAEGYTADLPDEIHNTIDVSHFLAYSTPVLRLYSIVLISITSFHYIL